MKRTARSPRRSSVPSAPKHPRYLAASVGTLLVSLWLGSPAPASAQSALWTGGTDDNWVTTASENNWTTGAGTFPGSITGTNNTDLAVFNTIGVVYINSPSLNIGSIAFQTPESGGAGFTIGSTNGNALLLTSGGSIWNDYSSATVETVDAPLVIEGTNGTYSLVNSNVSGSLAIGGSISGGAAGNTVLTLSGANNNTSVNPLSGAISNGLATTFGISLTDGGTWLLSGTNTYNGPTTIASGTLQAGSTQAFGVGSAVNLTSSSATLDLNGNSNTIGLLTGAAGSIVNNSSSTAATLTVGASTGITTFAGVIENTGSGGLSLIKQGTGTLTLSGANTYTGPTTVSSGTLIGLAATNASNTAGAFGVNSATTVGTGSASAILDLQGNITIGTLSGNANGIVAGYSVPSTLTIGSGVTSPATTTTFAGSIQNFYQNGSTQLALVKVGAGTQILSGVNTFNGGTTVNAGTLQLGDGTDPAALIVHVGLESLSASGAGAGVPAVVVNGSAAFLVLPNATVTGGRGGSGSGTGVNAGNGGAGVSVNSGNGIATVNNGGTILGGDGGPSISALGGTGGAGVSFVNGGSLTNSGTISGGGPGSGPTPGASGVGVSFTGGGTLVNLTGGTIAGGVVATDNSIYNVTLQIGSTITGGLNIGTNPGSTLTLTDNGTGGSQNYSAAVTGGPGTTIFNGSLIKNGAGTWVLDQAFNSSGPTTINAGTLAMGAANALPSTSAAVLTLTAPGATLDLHGYNTSIGSLTGVAGSFVDNSSSTAATLLMGIGPSSTAFAGVIENTGGGALSLAALGSGTLVLSGVNTYTGATNVMFGTLQVSGGGAISNTTSLNVGSGGTINIQNGGKVSSAAGSVDVGRVNVTGENSQWQSGSLYLDGVSLLLDIEQGGLVTSTGCYIGLAPGTMGIVTVDGAGSTWTTGNLTVGFDGQGTVNIQNAGLVSVPNGTVNLSGIGDNDVLNIGAFGGGTTAGTLNAASVDGSVSNGGTAVVNFNQTDTTTFTPRITGNITVNQLGTGTTILTGTNTYTGGTNLNAGIIGLGSDSAFGTGTVTVGGASIFAAGGDHTAGNAFTLNGGLTVVDDPTGPHNLTLSGVLSGGGGLTMNGTGTLILTGQNTFTGGVTLQQGTLQISDQTQLGQSGNLSFTGALNNVTGFTSSPTPADNLATAIQGYAIAPTSTNLTALQTAQTSYTTAVTIAEGNGTLPVLQITGAATFDGGVTNPAVQLFLSSGQAGGIVVAPGCSLTFQNYGGMRGPVIGLNGGALLDLRGGGNASGGYTLSFTNNPLSAGAIFNAGMLSISSATFSGNSSLEGVGGAIDNVGTLSISNAAFSGNSGLGAGAIFNDGTASISNATFSGNSAFMIAGGAISNVTTLSVSNATFSGNSAGSFGGAIDNSGTLSISNTTFSGNSAGYGGGGAISNSGTLSVSNTTFSGNSTNSGSGGAIDNGGGTLNLSSTSGQTSLLSGNTAGGAANSIYLNGGSTLNVETDGSGLVDMRDPMSGTDSTITKTGGGVWALGGSNTFAFSSNPNTLTVNAGTLYLYGAGEVLDATAPVAAGSISLAGSGSSFTLASGATFVAGGNNSISTDGTVLLASGSTLQGGSASQSLGGATPFNEAGGATSLTLTATGGITLGGQVNLAALTPADTFTLNATMGGSGSLNKTGLGTVILTQPSTFTGGVTLQQGTLQISAATQLGQSVNLSFTGALNSVTGFTSSPTPADNLGAAIQTYTNTPTATNLTALQGAQTSYNTAITNAEGDGSLPVLLITGPVIFDGGATNRAAQLVLNSGQAGGIVVAPNSSLTFQNYPSSGSGGAIAANPGSLLDLRGGVDMSGLYTLSFTGNRGNNSGGAIYNAGTMSVSDATFSSNSTVAGLGGAIFNSGTLSVSNATFSGNSADEGLGGAIDNSGTLSVSNATFSGNSASNKGGAIFNFGTLNAITTAGQTSAFTGNTANGAANSIYLNGGSTLNIQTDSTALLDMRDPMSGTASAITKTGCGVWALGGSNTFASSSNPNTFAVNAGTLYLYGAGEVTDANAPVAAGSISLAGSGSSFTLAPGATSVAGGNNSISTDGTIVLASGSTLQGGSASQSLGGATPFNEAGGATSLTLTATGGITLGGQVNVAALSTADTFTLNASMGGTGGLNKTGLGTVILTQPSTFVGGTTVNSGTLLVNNITGSGTGTGAVTVLNGATLGGLGTIGGAVTVNSGGTITGGTASTVGTLTLGGLTISSGGDYAVNLNGNGASDLLINGHAVLAGAGLTFNTLSAPTQPTYVILDATGGYTGTFTGVVPTGYVLIYTPDEVELSKGATFGAPITGTPSSASIITGGSAPFTFTISNTGPAGGNSLNATAAAGTNTTGSAGPITVSPQSTSSAVSGLSFNGTTIGASQTGTFTVSDPNATNNPQTGTVTVNVYGHAIPLNQSGTSLSLGYIHQGYASAVSSGGSISVQNGTTGDYIVNLAGSAPASGVLSLTSLAAIAPGATGAISATLAPGQAAGSINQQLTYTYADGSSLPGASSNLSQTKITVTGQVYTGQGTWNTNGSGNWADFTKWTALGGAPGLDPNFQTGDTATFGAGATSAAPTVLLNGVSPSISALTFINSAESYTIAQGTGGTLILNNSNSAATISVQSGSHTISAPVQLNSNLQVTTSAVANQLLISGVIGESGGAHSLTLSGPGTLTLTGANTYTGGTTISAGTLVLGNGSATGASLGSGPVTITSGTLTLDLASGGAISNAITDSSHLVTTGTSANNFTIAGAITGTGDFTSGGANTVTLIGANAYSGNTNVSGGALTVGSSTAASAVGGTVNISNGATLNLVNVANNSFTNNVIGNGALNLNFTNALTVSGTLSNAASGTLSLNQNGGANTLAAGTTDSYTGATTVNAGDLIVNGVLTKSALTVNAGTLSGTGDIAGTANVKGILAPGTPATPGLLTVGTLNLNASAVSDFRLGAMSAANDEVATNSLTLGGSLNVTELTGFGAGIYPLFTYNGALTNNGFTSITAAGSYSTALYVSSTSATQGTVDLLVAAGTAQYWDGAGPAANGKINGGSGAWNTTTSDWTNSTGAANAAWQSGTGVFAGTVGTVTLGSPVSARGLIFETAGYVVAGSSALTLTGTAPTITALGSATISAPIAGTTGLVDNGPGVVTLANPSNTYSGGTTVSGNLQIGTLFSPGSIGAGTVSINNGGNLSIACLSNFTLSNNVTNNVGGVGTLAINALGIYTVSGALTDGAAGQLALTQNGLDITILSNGGNTYSGPTAISTGILDVGTLTTAGSIGAKSQVSVGSSAALVVVNAQGNVFSNSINDASGGFVVFAPANNLTVSSAISGAGSVWAISGSPTSGLPCSVPLGATGTLTLTGNNTYTGPTTVLAGTMQLGNGVSGSLSPSSQVTTFPSATLALDLPSGASFANSVTNSGQVTATGATSYTVSGLISGSGSVSKTGVGTVTVTTANSYTGGTAVSGGTLVAANKSGSATGTGTVSVSAGGALGGNGTVSGPTVLNTGGDIFPGVTATAAGTTLHAASVTWNGGGTVTLDVGTSVSDELALSGSLAKGTSGAYTIDLLNLGIPTTTKENLTLMTFTSTTFAQSNFTLELPTGVTGTLIETKTSLAIDNLEATAARQSSLPIAKISSDTSSLSNSTTDSTVSADLVSAQSVVDASVASFSDVSQPTGETGGVTLSPTPEPGSAFLLALGFGTILGWRRRRHRSSGAVS